MKSFNCLFSILFFSIFCLSATSAIAHDDTNIENQISFSVNTEAEIANDQLIINMSAEAQGNNLEDLANQVNKSMAWALKETNKIKQIKAQTLNYQTQQTYAKGKPNGWRVTQSLSLSSKDIKGLSSLMGKLQSKLKTQSVEYQITPKRKKDLEDQLTTEALKLFSIKANKITQALQKRSFTIVQINISTNNNPPPRPMMAMSRGLMEADRVTTPTFQVGTQKVIISASGSIKLTD